MSVRYNPWGKPIEINGTGNFDASYIGTLIDATTGLIYVGNGQYYDPETGRFLTRGANPNSPNPYVPFNPMGAVFAPLALASIYYSRKKGNKSPWMALLFVGLFLAGCYCPIPGTPWSEPTEVSPTSTQTGDQSGNDAGDGPGNPGGANENPNATVCPPGGCNTETPSPVPTATPIPTSSETEIEKTVDEIFQTIMTSTTIAVAGQVVEIPANQARVKEYIRWLMDVSENQSLNTNHLAYIYATTQLESQWYNFTEIHNTTDAYTEFEGKYGRNSPYGSQLGNTNEGDGYTYFRKRFYSLNWQRKLF